MFIKHYDHIWHCMDKRWGMSRKMKGVQNQEKLNGTDIERRNICDTVNFLDQFKAFNKDIMQNISLNITRSKTLRPVKFDWSLQQLRVRLHERVLPMLQRGQRLLQGLQPLRQPIWQGVVDTDAWKISRYRPWEQSCATDKVYQTNRR